MTDQSVAAPAAEGRVTAAPVVEATAPTPRAAEERPSRGYYARAWEKLRRDPTSIAAGVVLAIILLLAVVGPPIAESVLQTTFQQQLRLPDGRLATLQPPSSTYPLGTDDLLTYSRGPSAAAGCARLASLAVLAGQHQDDEHAGVDQLGDVDVDGLVQVAPAVASVKATAARRADARACRPRLDSRAGLL